MKLWKKLLIGFIAFIVVGTAITAFTEEEQEPEAQNTAHSQLEETPEHEGPRGKEPEPVNEPVEEVAEPVAEEVNEPANEPVVQETVAEPVQEEAELVEEINVQEELTKYYDRADSLIYGLGSELINFSVLMDTEDAYTTVGWFEEVDTVVKAWEFIAMQGARLDIPESAPQADKDLHLLYVEIMEFSNLLAEKAEQAVLDNDAKQLNDLADELLELDEKVTDYNTLRWMNDQ
jgi:hypothetical protein